MADYVPATSRSVTTTSLAWGEFYDRRERAKWGHLPERGAAACLAPSPKPPARASANLAAASLVSPASLASTDPWPLARCLGSSPASLKSPNSARPRLESVRGSSKRSQISRQTGSIVASTERRTVSTSSSSSSGSSRMPLAAAQSLMLRPSRSSHFRALDSSPTVTSI